MLLANAMRLLQWAVGDIFITTNNINPQERFGGTWERFAKGKTLVGFDDSDSDFNEVNKTGGEKNHTLSESEMPKHSHYILSVPGNSAGQATYGGVAMLQGSVLDSSGAERFTSVNGVSQAHNNLQPYITVYFWRKTA